MRRELLFLLAGRRSYCRVWRWSRALVVALVFLLAGRVGICQAPAPAPEAAFLDPDKSAPAGTSYRTFYSRTIQGEASYLIYLPPDYESAAGKRYPVVYWLHGLGGNQRAGGAFVAQLDAAIRGGHCPALIAVLVNGLRDSRYYDSKDGKRPVETVIVRDLLPHIDGTYRTIAKREFRAIEGYSMGGFGAAHLGFKYPELFGAVSILAGALLDEEMAMSKGDLYQKNFGGDREYFNAGSPWVLVRENAAKIRGRTSVRIGVGERDSLAERNTKYHELLDSLNIRHQFFTVPGVAHEQARFYRTLTGESFEFYRKAFAAP